MKRFVSIALVVIAIQAALVGAYWLVELRRESERRADGGLGAAPPKPVDGPMPALALRVHDGTRRELRTVRRTTIVHFWATWCLPCREELPGILALPKKLPVDVLAVALDDDWREVECFFGGPPPATVFLTDDADKAEATFDVRTLPVTYVVEPERRLRFRFDGARDWGALGGD